MGVSSLPPGWLSDADWRRAQDTLPICCVDVLPVGLDDAGRLARVGLILRATPAVGSDRPLRWCLAGGRLRRNESLPEGAARQLYETLGSGVTFALTPESQPVYVAQYFTTDRGLGTVDIRQHAVACTFVVPIGGVTVPQGEAVDFRWFAPGDLPAEEAWGFGQNRVARECLGRWGNLNRG